MRKSGLNKIADEKFAPAIAELENSLYVVETNAPINKREGNKGQAELEIKNARSFREAIKVLEKYATAP